MSDRSTPLESVEIRAANSLVERALALLAGGPVATNTVATEVLALSGNPRAAAAAVFALLGSEPRVRVDAEGVWSLAESVTPPPSPLRSQEWVVVDVETTGGSPAHGHRVIEVAAVHVVQGEICGTFSSLVNPGRPISRMITSITGITNDMVAGAPHFEEIAEDLSQALAGKVFVGHNVGFDWGFVSKELEWCLGRAPEGSRLCTLRLARKILPHLESRSLGALADYFGIRMDQHHRALDDAVATARLLLRFVDDLEERGVTDWAGLEDFFRVRPQKRRRRTAKPRSMDAA